MRKVICDHCGKDCQNRIGRLVLYVEDQTKDGQQVGQTEFMPLDLDGTCIDKVREMFGFRVVQEHHMDEAMDRPGRLALANERFALPHMPDYPPDEAP